MSVIVEMGWWIGGLRYALSFKSKVENRQSIVLRKGHGINSDVALREVGGG